MMNLFWNVYNVMLVKINIEYLCFLVWKINNICKNDLKMIEFFFSLNKFMFLR